MDLSTAQTILTNWETAAVNLSASAAELASGATGASVSVTTPGGSWTVTRESLGEQTIYIQQQITYWTREVRRYKNTNKNGASQVRFKAKDR